MSTSRTDVVRLAWLCGNGFKNQQPRCADAELTDNARKLKRNVFRAYVKDNGITKARLYGYVGMAVPVKVVKQAQPKVDNRINLAGLSTTQVKQFASILASLIKTQPKPRKK